MKHMESSKGFLHMLGSIKYVFRKAKGSLTSGCVVVIFFVQTLYLMRYVFLALLPGANSTIVEAAIAIYEEGSFFYSRLVVAISILFLYALYNFLSRSISNVLSRKALKGIYKDVYGGFIKKISGIKYEYFNSPKIYEDIYLVKDKIGGLLDDIFLSGMFVSSLGIAIVVVYTFIGLAKNNLIIGMILLIANCTTIISTYLQTKKDFYAEVDQLSEKRWGDVFSGLLTSSNTEKEVRLYRAFDYIYIKWLKVQKERKKKSVRLLLLYSGMDVAIAVVKYLLLGTSLVMGIAMILNGTASADILILIYSSHTVLDGKLTEFFGSLMKLKSLSFYVDKWKEIDGLEEEAAGVDGVLPYGEIGINIDVCGLTYRYEGAASNAVEDVTFSIKAGEKVGIVGENGSGKTTLVHLLLGLLTPVSGSIRFNQTDSTDVMRSFREQTAVMFQDFCCYELSVRDNIKIGDISRKMSEENLSEVARRAGLDSLVSDKKDGFDTKIGSIWDGGIEFSGGQRQRIALSRLYARPGVSLVIMDEPTSALDPIAETELYNRIMEDFARKGLIMVSHRLGYMNHLDKIIVMDKGRIVDIGKHDQLMKRCTLYREMYLSFMEVYAKA